MVLPQITIAKTAAAHIMIATIRFDAILTSFSSQILAVFNALYYLMLCFISIPSSAVYLLP
jgi:hypothetical protein